MTACDYGNQYDWIDGTGSEESGGIFSSATYSYTIYDSAGNTLSGGEFHFETRAVGSTTWTLAQSETPTGNIGSGLSGTITVASGDEMRLTTAQ